MIRNVIGIDILLSPAILIVLISLFPVTGCKKFVQVNTPSTSINQDNVFKSDATAIAAVTAIYSNFGNEGNISGRFGISCLSGLAADELTLAGAVSDNKLIAYYRNQLRSTQTEDYGTDLWGGGVGEPLYYRIFKCNAAIEGLLQSETLTPAVKNQLLGESRFLRAFSYFYLAGFYGDVPLCLTTNPNITARLPRTVKQKVYEQVVNDLKEAQELLSPHFLDASLSKSTSERLRPTKWAATALLARTYLYAGQYEAAEAEAAKLISNSSQFSLVPITDVFLKNSTESIWQVQPIQPGLNTIDAYFFVLPSSGPNANSHPVYLSPQQLDAFEPGDGRRKPGAWVDSVIVGGTTYYYPAKYRAVTTSGATFTEYLVMFRLAEQYLIRAEARAKLNNIQGAQDDLNVVRSRAGLPNTAANDEPSILAAILKERQAELFTEFGQRWLDLKRTGNIDQVMTHVTPLKGNTAGWKSYQQLYPVPMKEIQMNPNLVQNPGY
jgi:hypothetical protein